VPAAAAALTFAVVFLVLSSIVGLYDNDSYYHLAVAREYAHGGIRSGGLSWARFSSMSQGFGDKELLFHVLVAPFAAAARSALPGKLAIALFDAAIAAVLARLVARTAGGWAALVPIGVLLGSTDLATRLLRLRPELLSLLLLLVALELAAARRYFWLGTVALGYGLGYTAFQTLPILCTAWVFVEGLTRRRWDWDLIAYPLLGTSLAVFVHPQFPANISVWLLQNVLWHRYTLPDAGTEFARTSLTDVLQLNGAWALGLACAWLLRTDAPTEDDDERRLGSFAAVAAVLFAALLAILPRFATYFVPFTTIAVLCAAPPRQRRTRAAAVLIALAIPLAARNVLVVRENLRLAGALDPGREEDARAFGSALPRGALVAAPWAETERYVFWAPQGRYLNVLDPVFMASWRPEAYALQLGLFDGAEPDVPIVAGMALESDFVATARDRPIVPRLLHDPRLRLLHDGRDLLFALVLHANRAFVRDWRVAPKLGTSPKDTADLEHWGRFVRPENPRVAALFGFVDAAFWRGAAACELFARGIGGDGPTRVSYRFAPWGPAEVWIDGEQRFSTSQATHAVLGGTANISAELADGRHVLAIRTCPAGGRNGFYLLDESKLTAEP
jgi:hypothetical protein